MSRPRNNFTQLANIIVALIVTLQITCSDSLPYHDGVFMHRAPLDMANYGHEQPNQPSFQDDNKDSNTEPISLENVLNHKVKGPPAMCPRQNVILFFLTGNMEYLRSCVQATNNRSIHDQSRLPTENYIESGFHSESSEDEEEDMSYSGRLLKRILQNMNDGTIKVDFPPFVKSKQQKRARLSINSALTSLADMLRHETGRQHSKPVYGFHSKLLKMG